MNDALAFREYFGIYPAEADLLVKLFNRRGVPFRGLNRGLTAVYISMLRAAMDECAIETTPDGYRLTQDGIFECLTAIMEARGVRLPSRVAEIVEDVERRHDLPNGTLLRPCRLTRVVRARWEAWWLVHDETRFDGSHIYSYAEIGRLFGYDHSTVIYGCRRHAAMSVNKSEVSHKNQQVAHTLPVGETVQNASGLAA
jgi:chromosomal replication initiation ATPase DnaA